MQVNANVVEPNAVSLLHRVLKNSHFVFAHNFGKWTLIFHNSFTVRFCGNFFLYICYRVVHLTLAVLLHYLAKSENPIYSCFKNNPFLFSYFFIPLTLWPPNSPGLNLVNYAVCEILQERVQAPPDHGRGRAAPACRGRMGPSGPGSDSQRDQWMAQATDSLCCSRLRTFWTFTLNITAFVHILNNMFWTLLTLQLCWM